MLYGFWVFNFPVYILSDSILFGFPFCRIRLVVVATQKFVAEVASDALQYATELFDYKLRPVGLPTPKKHIKSVSPSALSSRASLSKQLYKNPGVLIGIAREIKSLSSEEDVSVILTSGLAF